MSNDWSPVIKFIMTSLILTRFSSARQSSILTITWNNLREKTKIIRYIMNLKRAVVIIIIIMIIILIFTWYERPMQHSQLGMSLSKQRSLWSAGAEHFLLTPAVQRNKDLKVMVVIFYTGIFLIVNKYVQSQTNNTLPHYLQPSYGQQAISVNKGYCK